jgi:PAS domain S-box-containing protein
MKMIKTEIRALLVEDNALDVVLLRSALEKDPLNSYGLTMAERIRTAREHLKTQQFDIILLDLGLPDSLGMNTFLQVQQFAPQVPVIILSGIIDEESSVEAVQAGAQDYILKSPEGFNSICRAIRYAIERKKNQEALRISEERYMLAMMGANDGLWDWDLDSGSVYYSPRWKSMLGYSENEIEPHVSAWTRLIHPDDLPKALAAINEVVTGITDKYEIEFRMRHKDRHYLDILSRAFFLRRAPHGSARLVGTHVDITERKKAEAESHDNELKFRAIFESSQDAIGVVWEGVHTDVNPAYVFMFGYENAAELVGKPFLELVAQESQPQFKKLLELRGHESDAQFSLETIACRKDGSLVELDVHASFYELGGEQFILIILRNISTQKQMQAAATWQTSELSLLLEAARELSTTQDLGEIYSILYRFIAEIVPCEMLVVSSFNPTDQLIRCEYIRDDNGVIDGTGFPPIPLEPEGHGTQSRVIRSGKSLFLPDYISFMEEAKYYLFDENGAIQNEGIQDDKGEEDRPRSAILVPLAIEGNVVGVLQIFHSRKFAHTEEHLKYVEALVFRVTAAMNNAMLFEKLQAELAERWRIEEEIRKLNLQLERRVTERTKDLFRMNTELQSAARAKDEFLASMSHELRTPLNAILTLTESLEEGIYGDLHEKQVRPLRTISESGHHLLNLINDILDLSKIEAGKLILQIGPVEIEMVCDACIRLIRQQAMKKNLEIFLQVDPELRDLNADSRYLKQMLLNLLSNSLKFTPAGGKIGLQVRGDANRGAVDFTVWDTGIGVSAENARRIFSPFVQAEGGLSRHYGGTGLGLSLVYRMADLHGGSVSLESTVGEGSRFTISLPWSPVEEVKEPPQSEVSTALIRKALTILDANASDELEPLLHELGIETTRLLTTEGSPDVVVSYHPEIIFLDIQSPGQSGWEILERLKTDPRTQAVPIIVTANEIEWEPSLSLGVFECVRKPVTKVRVQEAIQKVTAQAEDTFEDSERSISTNKPLILVGDDSSEYQSVLFDHFSKEGYRVILAINGAEVNDRTRSEKPDIILMDAQMPGMTFLDTVRRIRENPESNQTPIIVLSCLMASGDREMMVSAGVNEYLAKPVSLTNLTKLIQAFLQKRQGAAQ